MKDKRYLFRAKDFQGNWVYGSYYEKPYKNDLFKSYILNSEGKEIEVDNNTICSYLGIKDSYNKKIFEKDILYIYKHSIISKTIIGIVEFIEGKYLIVTNNGNYSINKIDDSDIVKVNGNILDNPDMFKAK